MSASDYIEWVERVFGALVEEHTEHPLAKAVGLTPVAERLGLGPLSGEDFGRHEDPGDAILEALDDLARLGLVQRIHVSSGNVLTTAGRAVIDHGFKFVREEFHEGRLSRTERALLSGLVDVGQRGGDGWTRLAPVDPEPIWAGIWEGTDEHVGRMRMHDLLGDLDDTDYVSLRERPLVRPRYKAAAALTRPDPTVTLSTRLIDWSFVDAEWSSVEDRISDLKVELQAAMTVDDLQDVGRRCREIAMESMEIVVDPSMVPAGEPMPSTRDAKRLLDLYLAARAPGERFEEYRKFLRAALALANAQVRAKTLALPGAVASAQGLVSFVRALQFLDSTLAKRDDESDAPGPVE